MNTVKKLGKILGYSILSITFLTALCVYILECLPPGKGESEESIAMSPELQMYAMGTMLIVAMIAILTSRTMRNSVITTIYDIVKDPVGFVKKDAEELA